MTIEVILNDFDNTLFDSISKIFSIAKKTAKQQGIELNDNDFSKFLGMGVSEGLEYFLKEHNINFNKKLKVITQIKGFFALNKAKLFPDTIPYLDLHQEKKHAVVSNSPSWYLNYIMSKTNLSDRIPVRIAKHPLFKPKPSPDMLNEAVSAFGTYKPNQVLMVGDSPIDIIAGNAYGCKTILINRGNNKFQNTKAKPDYIVKSLIEITDDLIDKI